MDIIGAPAGRTRTVFRAEKRPRGAARAKVTQKEPRGDLTRRIKGIQLELVGVFAMRTWVLSEILRQRMLEEGLPYKKLARKLGLAPCSVHRFLTGTGYLRMKAAERLMQHYGLAVIELPQRRGQAEKGE